MIRFPYQPDVHTGIPCWRPLVPLVVAAGTAKRRTRAVVDTGSSDTIFPLKLANVLGVSLATTVTHGIVWRGQSFPLQFATVELELSDGWAGFRWTASVGFTPGPLIYPFLGIRGGLQFFDATFCGKELAVEFTINSSFQGTVF
jgi:hypothetical protein